MFMFVVLLHQNSNLTFHLSKVLHVRKNFQFFNIKKMFLRKFKTEITFKTPYFIGNYHHASSAYNSYPNNGQKLKRKPEDLVQVALESIKINQPQDWDKVKEFVLNNELNKRFSIYNPENIHGKVMHSMAHLNRLDLGNSYLKYLEEKNMKPNLATLGRYLKLLYENYKDKLPKAEETKILSICEEIQKDNPILESRTLENMALALSLTKEWRKCIDIIEEIKKTSSVAITVYSALIAAAFVNKEEQLAWDILNEVLSLDKTPLSVTFLSYLRTLKRQRKRDNIINNLEKLFEFFKDSEINCTEEVVNDIVESFHMGQKTTVKFSGQCENCNTKLKKLELNDAEFAELKEVFFNNAIVGKDVFIKTNPEEIKRFQRFVANMGQYDVVLDGLNVAYSAGVYKGPDVFSNRLRAVVSHFVQQKKSVLMLGRVHMTRWPTNNWNFIKRNADIFLTQNISQDDPYLLYCALNSGKDTIIVSKDLMRGHKFLLKERKYKILFNRWMSERQYFLLTVNEQGRVFFRTPPHFSTIAQKNENIWHIPYTPEDDTVNEMYQKTWLCLNCS